jgi:D-sedoheptulose 7-phosphate isomerase
MTILGETLARHPQLKQVDEQLQQAFELLRDAIQSGGKLMVCGNGGSAADSEHIVGELLKGFLDSRPLTDSQRSALVALYDATEGDRLAKSLQRSLPAISLVSHTALMTAVANDTDPTAIFAQQVYGLGQSGDVLIAISTSGNSRNVVMAAQVARAFGIRVLALTGQSGGALLEHADIAVRVPATRVDAIQELHMPVYHCLCAMLEDYFFVQDREALPDSTTAPSPPLATSVPGRRPLPEKIALVVFDFDGVFTDGKVYTDQNGVESIICDRRDGLGIDHLRNEGIPAMILSTETNPVVAARARKLKLETTQSCGDKAAWLRDYMEAHDIAAANVVYVGDDINDLGAMKLVGYPVAPANAHPAVKEIAALVLGSAGGDGAVREICDLLINNG